MKTMRIIITLICLALAILTGMYFGEGASAFTSPISPPETPANWYDDICAPEGDPEYGVVEWCPPHSYDVPPWLIDYWPTTPTPTATTIPAYVPPIWPTVTPRPTADLSVPVYEHVEQVPVFVPISPLATPVFVPISPLPTPAPTPAPLAEPVCVAVGHWGQVLCYD